MTRLQDALDELGLTGRIGRSGRWLQLDGEQGHVYVVESEQGDGFYSWCDRPGGMIVEHHTDPVAAIRSGLERASRSLADRLDGEGGD
jgi:uncharacterized FAD-dependent dehydrogenase